MLVQYYKIYPLFAYCCVGAELFYVGLYLLFFVDPTGGWYGVLWQATFYGCMPACLLKQAVNLVQLWSACYNIAAEEVPIKD